MRIVYGVISLAFKCHISETSFYFPLEKIKLAWHYRDSHHQLCRFVYGFHQPL